MKIEFRNLMKPKMEGSPTYFNIIPYISIVTDGQGRHIYFGWLSYCLAFVGLDRLWDDSEYYVESLTTSDSTGCNICGSKMTIVRGKHPKDPKRKVCPTCAVEKLEEYEFQDMMNKQIPNKSDST